MTHKPGIIYKGKKVIKDQPGQVIVDFLEDGQDVFLKLKHFHYEVMLKILTETPRKALKYAKANGVVCDVKTQKHHIINIEDGLNLGDTQSNE